MSAPLRSALIGFLLSAVFLANRWKVPGGFVFGSIEHENRSALVTEHVISEAALQKDTEEAGTSSSFQPSSAEPMCFLHNVRPCKQGEGIGGLFRRMEWILAIAAKFGCSYVCNVDDWPTGHGTGKVGHLFGCERDRVIGHPSKIVAQTAIKGLKSARTRLTYKKSSPYVVRYKKGQPLLRSSAWTLEARPKAEVWEFKPDCKEMMTVTHETTWKWIQGQYNAVRLAKRRDENTAWGTRRVRIALQLRRGDRPRACPLYLYLNALRDMSKQMPWITMENSQILIIGQVDVKSPEFLCLTRRLQATFSVAKKAVPASFTLQRDLDHIATSDILILGGGGSFSSFAATLQWNGIILHSRTKDSALDGLPHAYALDSMGRFPCNNSYDFSQFSARFDSQPRPQHNTFHEQVELAIQDYQMWYEDSRPCKTGRDGFDVGKRCVPPVFSPACSNGMVKSYDFEGPMSKQDSTEVNVTAALYPLDKTYSASTKVCPAASCLGKPGKECGRFYCCKSQGSIPDAVMLSHDHVAVLLLGCRGNINHEFHQSFWPFFWWTTIYANTNFAILVDRMSEHPRVKCESPFWQEDLFWKLASVKRWKIYNMSTGPQNYCTTGQLHLMKGLKKCCDFQLKPPALLHAAKRDIFAAVLGTTAFDSYQSKVLIYTRAKSKWRRILDPEKLLPLFRQDLAVEIVDDMPATLEAQARLFASAGLVLAPNGGWAPNVIFMPPDSCLIELHLYRLDSWVARYHLASTVGEVLLIVGDYRDPKKDKVVRPKRIGGDDDFLVEGAKNHLFEDIYKQMAASRLCHGFLKKS